MTAAVRNRTRRVRLALRLLWFGTGCATSLGCISAESAAPSDADTSSVGALTDAAVASSTEASTGDATDLDRAPDASAALEVDAASSAVQADAAPSSDAGETDSAADAAAASTPHRACLQVGSGDYAAAGPYRVRRETVDLGPNLSPSQSTGEFTIFSPETLEEACPHPIASWVNATAVMGTETYAFYQEHAASWGIVVIASHDSNGSNAHHTKAIDYLLARNQDPGSRFYRKLSSRAGMSGHVQGASLASSAAVHPSVQTVVLLSPNGIAPLRSIPFLCLSGTEDLSVENCRVTVMAAAGAALEAIWKGGDRTITQTLEGYLKRDPGTIQGMRLYAAWFRCFLDDDAAACGLFRGGQSCGLCDEPGWAEIVSKNL